MKRPKPHEQGGYQWKIHPKISPFGPTECVEIAADHRRGPQRLSQLDGSIAGHFPQCKWWAKLCRMRSSKHSGVEYATEDREGSRLVFSSPLHAGLNRDFSMRGKACVEISPGFAMRLFQGVMWCMDGGMRVDFVLGMRR